MAEDRRYPGTDNSESLEVEADVIKPDGTPMYPLNRNKPDALVIHCGDPRFQEAFRRFITEELGIASYAPVVIGGGAHALAAQSFLPKNFKILWQQAKFFINQQNLKQVIIINHEDCIWYQKMSGFHPTVKLPVKGRLDLKKAASIILGDFAGIKVRTYWAGIENGRVYFAQVE